MRIQCFDQSFGSQSCFIIIFQIDIDSSKNLNLKDLTLTSKGNFRYLDIIDLLLIYSLNYSGRLTSSSNFKIHNSLKLQSQHFL